MSSIAMLIAVVATLLVARILTPIEMLAGLVLGAGIGAVLARQVAMTAMPEMVGALNGFGGIASALVAGAEIARYFRSDPASTMSLDPFDVGVGITIMLSILIGIGQSLALSEKKEDAVMVMACALSNEATEKSAREEGYEILAEIKAQMPQDGFATAWEDSIVVC